MSEPRPKATYLLYTAAATTVGAALFFLGWMINRALTYPGIQASQFGYEAPLWIPFGLFVTGCAIFMAYLFVRAGKRVEQGEDLFAKRHRKHPSRKNSAAQDSAA